jgi:hypothetical protein
MKGAPLEVKQQNLTTETQFVMEQQLMLFAGAASIVTEVASYIQPLASVTV